MKPINVEKFQRLLIRKWRKAHDKRVKDIRAAAAPAVCVWRFNLERSVWRTHCGQYYGPFQAGDREPMKLCYHCSAPIKFTEAK